MNSSFGSFGGTCLFVLVIALPLFFVSQVTVTNAYSETEVSVNPVVNVAKPGESFIVNITVTDVQNLYGVEVTVLWNASFIKLVEINVKLGVETHSDGILHEPIFIAKNQTDNDKGEYSIAGTSTEPAPPFNGSGNIVTLTFMVINSGSCPLNIETKLADWPPPDREPRISQPIPHMTISGFWRSFTIQELINSANSGDIIYIQAGLYLENLVINKSLTLIGEASDTTFIISDGGTIINITANHVSLSGVAIIGGDNGIIVYKGRSVNINDNIITDNFYGISVVNSSNVKVFNNIVSNSSFVGISLTNSTNVRIIANVIQNNENGIAIFSSNETSIYYNNFVNNVNHVKFIQYSYNNTWWKAYPSGGNYWSDYDGTDKFWGVHQDQTGSDGIGDTPYSFGATENSRDKYPLMAAIHVFEAGTFDGVTHYINLISNSTVSGFYFNPSEGAFLKYNVTGEGQGFSRVSIPKNLLWTENGWTIFVGGVKTEYVILQDENFTYLYFTYPHSTKTVEIRGTHVIPEFSSPAFLFLLVALTLLFSYFTALKNPLKVRVCVSLFTSIFGFHMETFLLKGSRKG